MNTRCITSLLICLAMTALGGCGDTEPAPEKPRELPEADRSVLADTVKALEEDVAYNDVRQDTVISVITALRDVEVKMRREGLGTAEDRAAVLDMINRLESVRSTGGPIDRSIPETDGPVEQPKPGHKPIAVAPMRALLPELKALARSLEGSPREDRPNP